MAHRQTLDVCDVCGGSGIPAGDCDCDGNVADALGVCGGTCGADVDGDGICDDVDECADLTACNYDGAGGGGGSCVTLSLEEHVVHTSGTLAGQTTYRLYAVLPNETDFLSAVKGEGAEPLNITTTTSFYQDPNGGADGTNINSLFFQFVPELQYDSWVTIGHAPEDGTAQQNLTIANSPNQNWIAAFEAGGDIVMDDIFGGLWSIFNDGNSQGLAGADKKVLIAQLTTDGTITAQLTAQYFPDYGCCSNGSADGAQDLREYVNLSTSCGSNNPCEYDDACGVCGGSGTDVDADGICDDVDNCTDVNACNFDDVANGACQSLDACDVCGGSGTDTDADGICDDVDNCTDLSACNFDDAANGACQTLDACDVCGGSGTDTDADGICDDVDNCTDLSACNFDDAANGACQSLDACDVCGGSGTDTDADGICDDVDNCTDLSACNFNDAANGACQTLDACDVCGGSGTDTDADGICDDVDNCTDLSACNFNDAANGACQTLDACDVCGGSGTDTDADGICDDVDNCTDTNACNFDDAANGTCQSLDACNICGGSGTDVDADGICDDVDNCTDTNACNFSDPANGTCQSLDECGVCGGSGIPAGECDCNGNVLDALDVCGGDCSADVDDDGVCDTDEIPGCTDENACNYNAAATDDDGSCESLAALVVPTSRLQLRRYGHHRRRSCESLSCAGCTDNTRLQLRRFCHHR